LEVLILWRSVRTGLYREFRLFYGYIFLVLLQSLSLYYVYIEHPPAFQLAYWLSQIPLVLFGYAVIAQISSKAFQYYPGVARLSRRLVVVILILILAHAVFTAATSGPGSALGRTSVELERNARATQAILLTVFFGLTAYYAIPIGRNLAGISVGYGLFVGTTVVDLAIRAHFPSFQPYWEIIQPVASLLVLVVWTLTLWSHHESRESKDTRIETDYETLALHTIRALRYIRAHLIRS
jgi:hypothetical protein